MGRDQLDGDRESPVGFRANRTMSGFGGCWKMREVVVTTPVGHGPDRAPLKTATAIGANIVEHSVRAIVAKGAFKRTDARVVSVRRQWLGAVFTDGTQFKHLENIALHSLLASS